MSLACVRLMNSIIGVIASSRASKQEMPGAENMSLHARQSLHTEKSFGDIESIMTEVRIHVRDRLESGASD